MSDAVAPRSRAGVVAVRQPARQYLVDVSENQSLLGRRQDRHRDKRDVRLRMRGFSARGKVGRQVEVTCRREKAAHARVVRTDFAH